MAPSPSHRFLRTVVNRPSSRSVNHQLVHLRSPVEALEDSPVRLEWRKGSRILIICSTLWKKMILDQKSTKWNLHGQYQDSNQYWTEFQVKMGSEDCFLETAKGAALDITTQLIWLYRWAILSSLASLRLMEQLTPPRLSPSWMPRKGFHSIAWKKEKGAGNKV